MIRLNSKGLDRGVAWMESMCRQNSRCVWVHAPSEIIWTLECQEVRFGVYLVQIRMFYRL